MILEIAASIFTLLCLFYLSQGKIITGNITAIIATLSWIIIDIYVSLWIVLITLHLPILLIHGFALWKNKHLGILTVLKKDVRFFMQWVRLRLKT